MIVLVQFLDSLSGSVNCGVQEGAGVWPVTVQILAEKVASSVAQVDAVGIHDGNDLENDKLAKVLSHLMITHKEIDEAL